MPAARSDPVPVTFTRAEALALEYVAERGLVAVEAFNLTASTTSAKHALTKLRTGLAGATGGEPAPKRRRAERRTFQGS